MLTIIGKCVPPNIAKSGSVRTAIRVDQINKDIEIEHNKSKSLYGYECNNKPSEIKGVFAKKIQNIYHNLTDK